MQDLQTNKVKKVVFFGTGGTISGLSSDSRDVLNYKAGLVNVSDLAQNALSPQLKVEGFEPVYEQIAQVDSKDMAFPIWQKLLERLLFWSKDPLVEGFLITHGTDTIEETAFFLYLATLELDNLPTIALTCAMRPASADDADGPQNLRDATTLLLSPDWRHRGVVVVCAGVVHHACCVQKIYTDRLDAFSSLPHEPLGRVIQGRLVNQSDPPSKNSFDDHGVQKPSLQKILQLRDWPWVEIVQNYAQNTGALIKLLLELDKNSTHITLSANLGGLGVAGTGIGTVSDEFAEALKIAQQRGILIWQSSKCAFAVVKSKEDASFYDFHGLSPVKARIALAMHLIACSAA